MKHVRVKAPLTEKTGNYGVLKGDQVFLLNHSPLRDSARETGVFFPVSEITEFLPPVEPPNIIALGLNYLEHVREHNAGSNEPAPASPVIFLKATSSLTGHRQPIILPEVAPEEVDYEAELVVVIGKTARNVPEERAGEYIFGYTCGNDVSARDCQRRIDKQWARAKSFDTFAPVGPVIETDIAPGRLSIRSRLNGRVMQDDNTKNLIFNVPRLVGYLSRQMTLLPGTLIMTGTPQGVGFARTPPVFLKAGDVMEVEIEGIGTLRNPVTNG